MNRDIELSRQRISRRRALALGGSLSLAGLIAACAGGRDAASSSPASSSPESTSGSATATITADGDALRQLLDSAPSCPMTTEETEGPYWFDVDSIRSDITEDRPGTPFDLALRVQDLDRCAVDGTAGTIADAAVEIWHCDAGGVYSGFESGSMSPGGPPAGGPPPGTRPPGEPGREGPPPDGRLPGGSGSSEVSDGTYSAGERESTPTDDGTYLRGAQITDADGIVRFRSIFPGWYPGRTTHIHVRVHLDRSTVLTTQIYFDDAVKGEIYARAPYTDHPGWEDNTQNSTDSIFDPSGMTATARSGDGYLGAVNLGISR